MEAARNANVQVIWDLCHWGTPEWLSPMDEQFPRRFAAFVREAVAVLIRAAEPTAGFRQIYCPINEISFWAWAGGEVAYMGPLSTCSGRQLKYQLVQASLAAIREIRLLDPEALIMQPEPLIHISPGPDSSELTGPVPDGGQFEAWDMLLGRTNPELGGCEGTIDILGANYYWNNQWIDKGERTPPGHPRHYPLHRMLADLRSRYQLPIIISETSAEAEAAVGWLGYVSAELRQAQRLGISVDGLCIYPVMDYPGWEDGRHCACGLIQVDDTWSGPRLRQELVDELHAQRTLDRKPLDALKFAAH